MIRRYSQYGGGSILKKQTVIFVGDLEINTDSKTVTRNQSPILLTTTEYQILELLALNRKKIFSMENIYQSIWQDNYLGVSDNAIMVHIKNLRRKLEVNPREPKYIKTAWGKGYYVD